MQYEPSCWWFEIKELLKKVRVHTPLCPLASQSVHGVVDTSRAFSCALSGRLQFFFCAVLMWMGPEAGGTSPDQIVLGLLVGILELVSYALWSPCKRPEHH